MHLPDGLSQGESGEGPEAPLRRHATAGRLQDLPRLTDGDVLTDVAVGFVSPFLSHSVTLS